MLFSKHTLKLNQCKYKIPFQSTGLTSQTILLLFKIRLEHAMVDLIFIVATYILTKLPRFLWLEIAFPRKAIYSCFLVPQLHSPSICASLWTNMNLRQNTTVLKKTINLFTTRHCPRRIVVTLDCILLTFGRFFALLNNNWPN